MSEEPEIAELKVQVEELTKALQELRDAYGACLRVITVLGGRAIDMLEDELEGTGTMDGVGHRTDAVLRRWGP